MSGKGVILQFPEGRHPTVARHDGKVAIFENDEGKQYAFVVSPGDAITLALAIFGAAGDVLDAEGKPEPEIDITDLGFRVVYSGAQAVGHLQFICHGARISGVMSDRDIDELAAALSQASSFIGGLGRGPVRDL